MYRAKITTDAGKSFFFSYENGVLFDISPLSGSTVNVGTSQGFGQIGETVKALTVGGIKRNITGKILNEKTAREMLSALPALSRGKLWFNDAYYCDMVISRTPEISLKKSGERVFSMQVYCDTPFWRHKDITTYIVNGYTAAFSFPVVYDVHAFGIKATGAFTNCINRGDVAAPIDCAFSALSDVTGYGIINASTGEILKFDDVLRAGETVSVKRHNGMVTAEKTTADGVVNVLSLMTDDSELLSLTVGDNVFKAIADENDKHLTVAVNVRPAYMGVIAS